MYLAVTPRPEDAPELVAQRRDVGEVLEHSHILWRLGIGLVGERHGCAEYVTVSVRAAGDGVVDGRC